MRGDDGAARERLRAIANERWRFGYRRLAIMLRRAGKAMNLKKIYRLDREERLTVRKRGGRKRALGTRAPMTVPQGLNRRWSLDFVSNALACGRLFRVLNVIDDWSRECPASVIDTSLSGKRVVRELAAIVERQRQWHRADQPCCRGVVRGNRHRMALHRTRQADPERLRGAESDRS